jgi:hypothetical protein
VFRDTDTMAYERMMSDGSLVFGWMFRPVLGRRAVSPGMRQLFAVIAMPKKDCDQQEALGVQDACTFRLAPTVRTYWKKFDRTTQTSFDKHDANRASKFWYGLSAGLSRPQIFNRHFYPNATTYHAIPVRSSAEYEDELGPVVQTVSWHATGEKTVVVSVTGRNFFTNTEARLGDTTYSEANKNLVIQSNQSMELMTTFDQLASGSGSILGRYGLSVPIVQPGKPPGSGTESNGFRMEDPQIGPVIDGYRTLDISLMKRAGAVGTYLADRSRAAIVANELTKPMDSTKSKQETEELQTYFQKYRLTRSELLDASGVPKNSSLPPPVVSINGNAIRIPSEIFDIPEDRPSLQPAHVQIHTSFPDSLMNKGAALIQVSWPFYNPEHWTDARLFTDPDDQFKVDRVSADTILIRREGNGGFDSIGNNPCWKFVGGDSSVLLATAACPRPPKQAPPRGKGKHPSKPDEAPVGPVITGLATVASVTVGDKEKLPEHAVLLDPEGGIYHLTIPDFPAKKSDTADKPLAMKQNDSTWINIKLPEGKTAKVVEANGAHLEWRPVKDDKAAASDAKKTPAQTIEVEITRALSAKAGSVDVSVFDASGTSVARRTIAIACTGCGEKRGEP